VPAAPRPAAPTAAAAAERQAALKRAVEWPADTADLARCEIQWAAGYRSSRFAAVVHHPGRKRGEPIGGSEPFKWTLKELPSRREPAYVEAVKRLRAALLDAGWEEIEPGPTWYARRFVWRREGSPPAEVGSGGAQPPLS
jgi:hypothetical protein